MLPILNKIRDDSLTTLLTILLSVATLRGMVGVFLATTPMNTVRSAETAEATLVPQEANDEIVNYDKVQPILRKHCLNCHNENEARGGLSLSSIDKIESGSTSGDVVVPGAPEESLLYLVTAHLENPKMPPNKPRIPARELALIEKWILTGLPKELGANGLGQENSSTKVPDVMTEESVGSEETATTFVEPIPLPQLNPVTAITAHDTQPVVIIPGLQQLLWIDSSGKQATKGLPISASTVTTLTHSRDGKRLLVGCGTPGDWGKVLRFDLESMQWEPPIGEETDTPLCVSESPDGRFIAIGNSSKNINIYEINSGKLIRTLKKHTDWVTFVSWSPDGLLLASGDRFGSIHLWETGSDNVFTTLRNHIGSVTGLVWSNDGDELFSTGWDGTLRRWDLHTQNEIQNWNAHGKGSHGLMSLSNDRTTSGNTPLISYGRDGMLRVWTVDGELLSERSMGEEIVAAAFASTSDSKNVFACDAGGAVVKITINADHRLEELETKLTVPLKTDSSEFTFYRPSAPTRLASAVKADIDRVTVEPQVTDLKKEEVASKGQSASGATQSNAWKSRLADDLADSQRALESLEQSRAQLVQSLSQMEEATARLKQLIAIQEARIKQMELSEEPK